MSNTISSPSYFARTVSWLNKQTSETKANDNNTNSTIKWFAKRSRATNISLTSAILFLGSLATSYFTKDTDNRFVKYFVNGLKWFSAFIAVITPFANKKQSDPFSFKASKLFEEDKPDLKHQIVKALNEETIRLSDFPYRERGILPYTNWEKEYREKVYFAIAELANDQNDPLWLNTPIEKVPDHLKKRVEQFREGLITSYINERYKLYVDNDKNASNIIIISLENLFISCKELNYKELIKNEVLLCSEIPISLILKDQFGTNLYESTNTKYKEAKYKALENLFKDEEYSKNSTNERVVELHRGIFTAYEKEKQLIETNNPTASINALKSLESALLKSTVIDQSLWNEEYNFKQFENWAKSITQDKVDLKKIFYSLSTELKKMLLATKDLLQSNTPIPVAAEKEISELLDMIKTDLQFSADNISIESQVETLHFFTLYLDKILERIPNKDNEEKIFRILSKIVHNKGTFPHVKRNLDFFNNPSSNTVPGLALKVIHENRLCFNNDFKYIDPYGLRGLVLPQAVEMISSNRAQCKTNGFVLSGPPGKGKSLLATAIANQLAIPLYSLDSSFEEKMTELQEAIDNTPCVLLLDEIELSLPLNASNRKVNELKIGLKKAKQKRVIVIGTTNYPVSNSIKLSNIDDKGSSRPLEEELSKVIDPEATNIYQKIFIFHKPFTQKQGEQLAREFLKPYIESGKIKVALNYTKIGKILKHCTPASISSTLTKLITTAKEPISEKELITEFEKNAVYKYTNKEFQATRT